MGVVVLKELIFVSMVEECGGLERTDFYMISNVGRVWWS